MLVRKCFRSFSGWPRIKYLLANYKKNLSNPQRGTEARNFSDFQSRELQFFACHRAFHNYLAAQGLLPIEKIIPQWIGKNFEMSMEPRIDDSWISFLLITSNSKSKKLVNAKITRRRRLVSLHSKPLSALHSWRQLFVRSVWTICCAQYEPKEILAGQKLLRINQNMERENHRKISTQIARTPVLTIRKRSQVTKIFPWHLFHDEHFGSLLFFSILVFL